MVKVDFLLRRDGILGVKLDDIVAVEYIGTLDNGGVFDSSERHGGPLEFKVGGGQVLQGFEDAVLGMDPLL